MRRTWRSMPLDSREILAARMMMYRQHSATHRWLHAWRWRSVARATSPALERPTIPGLAGGVDSGDADLSLSANNLSNLARLWPRATMWFTPTLSDSHATKRITVDNFVPRIWPARGLTRTATGQLVLDLDEPALVSSVADGDVMVLGQASDSFDTKRVTVATLGTHFGTGGGGGGGTTVSGQSRRG